MDNNHSTSEKAVATQEGRPAPASLSDRVRSLRLEKPSAQSKSSGQGSALPWALCGIFAVLFLASTGGLGYFAYSKYDEASGSGKDATATSANQSASGRSNDTAAPVGEIVVESKGYVIPVHQIKVSPKVGGLVTALYIKEGDKVQKDSVLAELEDIDYRARYDRARATAANTWQKFVELYSGNRPEEIRQAKAQLEEMEANRDRLFLDWKRNSRLVNGGGAVAPKDYEQAQGDYLAMERRCEQMRNAYKLMLDGPRVEKIEAAWADVEAAEADVVNAKFQLDSCIVRAPVSGTILTKTAEKGSIVNPAALSIATAFCEMADLGDLEVDLKIQEREIAKVSEGQICRARAEAYQDRIYKGKVSRIMPSADRSQGAVIVRVKLEIPEKEAGVYLKPDMGVVVWFLKTEDSAKKK
jgi:multidrug resistance efflux pump